MCNLPSGFKANNHLGFALKPEDFGSSSLFQESGAQSLAHSLLDTDLLSFRKKLPLWTQHLSPVALSWSWETPFLAWQFSCPTEWRAPAPTPGHRGCFGMAHNSARKTGTSGTQFLDFHGRTTMEKETLFSR